MKAKARIGIGIRIFKHDLALYYNTDTKLLEGEYLMELNHDDGTKELLVFDLKLSGNLFLFRFKDQDGGSAVTVSIKQVAEQLFGDDLSVIKSMPDLKFSCTDLFFIYHKTPKGTDNELIAGIETELHGFEFDASFSVDVVQIKGSHLQLEKLLLTYASQDFKPQKKSVQRAAAQFLQDDDPVFPLLKALNITGLRKGVSLGALIQEGEKGYYTIAPMQKPLPPATALPVLQDESKPQKSSVFEKWVKMDKTLGPVKLQGVGMRFDMATAKAKLLLNAYIHMAAIEFSLIEFGVELDLANHFKPSLSLSGLGLGFSSKNFELGGAFMRQGEGAYVGMLNLRFKKLSITGYGGYQKGDDFASVFGYVVLGYPLGGPIAFSVKGLAAGFGYNRDLVVPDVKGVNNFPLIKWATGIDVPEGKDKASKIENFTAEVENIKKNIPVKKGQYWIAFGVKFSSFRYVDGFALFIASFGNRLEIDVLGTADMLLPKQEGKDPVVKVSMVLKARYSPDDGLFSLEAALTKGSYIFSKDCTLTGGMAYYMWFKGDHQGDFVYTIGGYAPPSDYTPPTHYPKMKDRVKLHWDVSDHVQLTGEGYLTITPACLMAGFASKLIAHVGSIKATFSLEASFMVQWAPFHYAASIHINLYVEYTKKLLFGVRLHLSAHIGVGIDISGPKFSGVAVIDVSIISFTIRFGPHPSKPKMDWDGFKQEFLDNKDGSSFISIAHSDGVREDEKEVKEEGEGEGEETTKKLWVVDPEHLYLIISSKVPSTSINGNSTKASQNDEDLYIRPLGGDALESNLKITLTDIPTSKSKDIEDHFTITQQLNNIPKALWGKSGDDGTENIIKQKVTGLEFKSKEEKANPTWLTIHGEFHPLDFSGKLDFTPKPTDFTNYDQSERATDFKTYTEHTDTRKAVLSQLNKQLFPALDKDFLSDTIDYDTLHGLRYYNPLLADTGNDDQNLKI